MSGDHDHDEYVREEVADGRFDDQDAALDAAYTAIQLLQHVCRTLLTIVSPIQPGTVHDLDPYLAKVEALVGELHEDPT